MEFVCPQPKIWHEIQKKLITFYLENKKMVKTLPPKALILNGWIYSTDYMKKIRWEETFEWAEKNKCRYLIPKLKESEKYMVNEIKPTFIQGKDPYDLAD